MGFALSHDSPPSGGERDASRYPPSTHLPPTDQPTITVVNGSGAVRTDQSTTAAQQYAPQRYTCGTPGAGWDLHFLTILHLPGESASRPRERLFMPPARGVEIRRSCVGRAWHGRAVAKGPVPRGSAESCKCTVSRVGRVVPRARERSRVILVRHIGVGVGWQQRCTTCQSLRELDNQGTVVFFWRLP